MILTVYGGESWPVVERELPRIIAVQVKALRRRLLPKRLEETVLEMSASGRT